MNNLFSCLFAALLSMAVFGHKVFANVEEMHIESIIVEIKTCTKLLDQVESDQTVLEGVVIRLGCLIVKIENDPKMFELAPSLLDLIIKNKKCSSVKVPDWLQFVDDYRSRIEKIATSEEVDPPFSFGKNKDRFLASFAEQALLKIQAKRLRLLNDSKSTK